jgi:hypothetical protein
MSKTVNTGIVGTQLGDRAHSNVWMDVDKFYELARPSGHEGRVRQCG